MRQIVLDTETTGLEAEQGHRVIEIGAVELVDRQLTGHNFHHYINPERDIDLGALEVHGLSREFLSDKPRFADIAAEFNSYAAGAELIIHNAPFDLGFLDKEFSLLSTVAARWSENFSIIDTLLLARDLHPGQRNSLDALCKRYEVDNSSRTLHGALLDSEILADVYLAMTGGQVDLALSLEAAPDPAQLAVHGLAERPALRVLRASGEENELHKARLQAIEAQSGDCLWLNMENPG
jgi:DNA polymerase-3 subunit epsilon